MRINKLIILIFVLLYSSFVCAESYESADNLKQIAKEFVSKNLTIQPQETMEIQINSLDLPERLAKCSKPIEASFPREANKENVNSVQLVCTGDKAWHAFIPVNVQIYTNVVVAKHLISSNEIISESDIDYAQANINRLYGGYFKDINEIKGFVAAQTINPGMVISKKSIRRPTLVHKNQEIDLVAKKGGVEVSIKAIAKSEGALDDTIVAFNPSSKKSLEAVIVGINRAEVRW